MLNRYKKMLMAQITNDLPRFLIIKKAITWKTNSGLTDNELLIDAVMKIPCLWNHTISMKQRNPLVIKEAWIEIASELNGNKLNFI